MTEIGIVVAAIGAVLAIRRYRREAQRKAEGRRPTDTGMFV